MSRDIVQKVSAAEAKAVREATGLSLQEVSRSLRILAIRRAINSHIEDKATRKILSAIMDLNQ